MSAVPLIEGVGRAFTFTVTETVLEQPFLVAVTLYDCVEAGVTVRVAPVEPSSHK